MLIEISKPLWDHRISLVDRSEVVKNNLWNEVFVQFEGEFPILGLKKSWKYIKEKYTREKKLGPSGCEGGKKEWIHLKNLKFLDDVKPFKNDSTVSQLVEHCAPKLSKKALVETHISSLTEELKSSRPIPPKENLFQQPQIINGDKKFSSYLAGIMSDIPRKQKIILQAKIIAMVVEELV